MIGPRFLTILGKSRGIHNQYGRPAIYTLISDKDAAIFCTFHPRHTGVKMGPEIRYSYPRLGSRNRGPLIPDDPPAKSQRLARDLRAANGEIVANPPPISAAIFLVPNRG